MSISSKVVYAILILYHITNTNLAYKLCVSKTKRFIYSSVVVSLIKMLATNNYAMVTKTFYNKTVEMSTFTSDDFRKFKLDKRLKGESRNKIGGFFRYLHLGGFIVKAGKSMPTKIDGNHSRKISVWKWSKKIQTKMDMM